MLKTVSKEGTKVLYIDKRRSYCQNLAHPFWLVPTVQASLVLFVVSGRFYWHSLGPIGAIMAPRLPVATSSRSQTLKVFSWAPQSLYSPPVIFTVRLSANLVLTRCDWKRMCYFYFLGSFTCLPCAVAFIWSVRGTNSRLLVWLLAYSKNQQGPNIQDFAKPFLDFSQ